MADYAVQRLESVVRKCADQPLERPNVWLLQRGCVLADLAHRVYNAAQLKDAELEADLGHSCMPGVTPYSSPVQGRAAKVRASLLSGSPPGVPVHAIWQVPDLGVVVAFRGTVAVHDMYANIDFQPVQLSDSDIKLHGAIYRGAAQCIQNIQAAYMQAVQTANGQTTPALFLTGLLGSTCDKEHPSRAQCTRLVWSGRAFLGWSLCKLCIPGDLGQPQSHVCCSAEGRGVHVRFPSGCVQTRCPATHCSSHSAATSAGALASQASHNVDHAPEVTCCTQHMTFQCDVVDCFN